MAPFIRPNSVLPRYSPDSYPWWPAVIYEDDDPEVPRAVLKQRDRAARPVPASGSGDADTEPILHLVRFWDGRRQW